MTSEGKIIETKAIAITYFTIGLLPMTSKLSRRTQPIVNTIDFDSVANCFLAESLR
jgi:hypothetical protein